MARQRIGMGLVGAGFVGPQHIDAVRRLGFVDVVAMAGSNEASAAAKAEALGVPRSYGSYEALIDDPAVQVVHNATPNHLHAPVCAAAIERGKAIVSDKPLAMTAREAKQLLEAADAAGVVHAVTFNYRGNPLVQHARVLIERGMLGAPHFIHGHYLQDWLFKETDFSWRLEPDKGGASSAMGDIGSHWCDLVQHVTGRRIRRVLADLTTVVKSRRKPSGSREAFAAGGDEDATEAFAVTVEDLGSVLLRFDGECKGTFSVGQVCAGHKNDLVFEVNGLRGSLGWRQERQNELWIGRRDEGNTVLMRDPGLVDESVQRYAQLPAGHQEGWADAFRNVMADIYGFIASGASPSDEHPPAFATFEDGYRSNCVVEAILESAATGNVWVDVGE